MPSCKVSLSIEVSLLLRTIDGMRIVMEKWRDGHFNEEEFSRLAQAIHATLILVRERLVLVDRGIRDTLNPWYILHPENEALEPLAADDSGDVVLHSWSEKKTSLKLKREAERSAHQAEVLAKRRKRRVKDEP